MDFFPQIRSTSQTVLWKFYPNILQRSDFRGASQTALWKLFRRSPNLSSLNRSLSTTRTPEPCQRLCRIRLSPRSISKEEWTPSLWTSIKRKCDLYMSILKSLKDANLLINDKCRYVKLDDKNGYQINGYEVNIWPPYDQSPPLW